MPRGAGTQRRCIFWRDAHPTAADTLLVIEVADASLSYDLDTKLRLYQQAGIANY
ncbi:Uma2 family endonuclease [Cyanobium sp. FGCU-52]|nr:Uma2 family endonuclease [Cyanobium sp. FGCU52]